MRGLVEDGAIEVELVKEQKGVDVVGRLKHPAKFLADAFAADAGKMRGVGLNGFCSVGINGEVESGGKTNSAKHTQVIFSKAMLGVADGTDDAVLEVGKALDVVDDVEIVEC